MSEHSPQLASFDHPLLSPSVGVREATPQNAAPRHLGKNRGGSGQSRGVSFSSVSKDTLDVPPDYFATSPPRPGAPPRAQSSDLRSGLASPVIPETSPDLINKPTTEIRAGLVQKPFTIHTALLVEKSPYFAALQNPEIATTSNSMRPAARLSGPFFFPDMDEFAFALLVRWIYGGKLHGPTDFHSMNHYLGLYVVATTFQIELLKNTVMDVVRHYYRYESMTAPAFRLDYIYTHTASANFMRDFLILTAVYRALSDEKGISESVKGLLKKGGCLASDFAEALVRLAKEDVPEDVRKGDDCKWHEHTTTTKCEPGPSPEPWEST